MANLTGIVLDISKWQLTPDFDKIKALYDNGTIAGVIIRVQHGYTIPDEKYTQYVAECKKRGIPFGTYAYFAGISINDSIAEADAAFDRTDKASLFFGLDIEEPTMADLVRGGQAYIDRLKAKGMQHVGLYSGESFWKAYNLGAIASDFQWVAKYGVNNGQPNTAPTIPETDLWQFTSTGKIDGIATDVDLNIITNHVDFPFFDKPAAVVIPNPSTNTTKYPVQPVSTGNPIVAKVEVIVDYLNCRQQPDSNSPVLFVARKGQQFNVTANIDDWHEVIIDNDGYNGYLYGNNGAYLSLIKDQPQPVYYVVKSGDSLIAIAKTFGSTVQQIISWNGIVNADLIKVGQRLRVK
jgi:GH25 family lysozyme M1 (1,4-beta-N-acetylmuramidase)